MALLATDSLRVSNLVKYEFEPATNFCNQVATVVIPTGGYALGTVLDASYNLILLANTANAAYVVVDPNISDFTAGSNKVKLMETGPAILSDTLVYGPDITTAAQKNAVKAVLANKFIKVATQA